MKKIVMQFVMPKVVAAVLLCSLGCTDDVDVKKDDGNEKTVPRAAVPYTAFSLWQSCSTNPYYYSNGVIVPVGGGV